MALQVARPKILGFIDEDVSAWLVLLLAFAAGGLLTGMLALATYDLYQQQVRQRFELLASERQRRIAERFDDQVQRLEGLRRFFEFSEVVDRREFDGYAAPLLRYTQAYSWVPAVSDTARVAFEKAARLEHMPQFVIHEYSAAGRAFPAMARPVHFPILYAQGQPGSEPPLGYDLASQPDRLAALERAQLPDSMSVSSPLNLVGVDSGHSRGVMVAASVYNRDHSQLRGFVTAVISLRRLMSEGLSQQIEDNLFVRITDLTPSREHELLYQSDDRAPPASDLLAEYTLSLADHKYALQILPGEAFIDGNRSSAVEVVVLLGSLLSLLLAALLYNLVYQRQRALALVEQRTAELRRSEQELRGTHSQLRCVLDAATQVAIISTDLSGRIDTFNAGAERMLGYFAGEVRGMMPFTSLLLPSELQATEDKAESLWGCTIDGQHEPREWTLVCKNGQRIPVNMLTTSVRNEQGALTGHLAICIDITEHRRATAALEARDRLLEKLTAEVPGGIYQFRLDPDGHSSFTYASEGLRDIYELDLGLLRKDAAAVFERIHPDDLEPIRASIRVSAERLTPWREEYRVVLPRAGLRWLRGEATPEPLAEGGTLWHGYLTDISDLKRVEEELRALSVTDALTGIYNRRYFQERLKAELDRAHRDSLDLSVIMIDIDHFKRINDEHGHAVGDHVLKIFCHRISQRLRRTDVFCRLGGEEFIILCPGSHVEQAHQLAQELWHTVRQAPIDDVGSVTASFGVAGWRPGEGADALLLRVDSGVYAAKQGGRDRVVEELA